MGINEFFWQCQVPAHLSCPGKWPPLWVCCCYKISQLKSGYMMYVQLNKISKYTFTVVPLEKLSSSGCVALKSWLATASIYNTSHYIRYYDNTVFSLLCMRRRRRRRRRKFICRNQHNIIYYGIETHSGLPERRKPIKCWPLY